MPVNALDLSYLNKAQRCFCVVVVIRIKCTSRKFNGTGKRVESGTLRHIVLINKSFSSKLSKAICVDLNTGERLSKFSSYTHVFPIAFKFSFSLLSSPISI